MFINADQNCRLLYPGYHRKTVYLNWRTLVLRTIITVDLIIHIRQMAEYGCSVQEVYDFRLHLSLCPLLLLQHSCHPLPNHEGLALILNYWFTIRAARFVKRDYRHTVVLWVMMAVIRRRKNAGLSPAWSGSYPREWTPTSYKVYSLLDTVELIHLLLRHLASMPINLVSPMDSNRLERSSSLHHSQAVYWFFQENPLQTPRRFYLSLILTE